MRFGNRCYCHLRVCRLLPCFCVRASPSLRVQSTRKKTLVNDGSVVDRQGHTFSTGRLLSLENLRYANEQKTFTAGEAAYWIEMSSAVGLIDPPVLLWRCGSIEFIPDTRTCCDDVTFPYHRKFLAKFAGSSLSSADVVTVSGSFVFTQPLLQIYI